MNTVKRDLLPEFYGYSSVLIATVILERTGHDQWSFRVTNSVNGQDRRMQVKRIINAFQNWCDAIPWRNE